MKRYPANRQSSNDRADNEDAYLDLDDCVLRTGSIPTIAKCLTPFADERINSISSQG